jgi:Zn-dependent metalloprotease
VPKADPDETPTQPKDATRQLQGGQTIWDEEMGLLRKARGLLTEESDEPPEQIARRFLERYSHLLGKAEGSILDHLKLTQIAHSPAGHRLSYQQYVGEIPVHRGQISVQVTEHGQVYRITSAYRPDAAQADAADVNKTKIEPSAATQIAVEEVKGEGRLRREPEARLVIVPAKDASHLAWQVNVALDEPPQSWEVFVDAHSGQVLDSVQTLMAGAKD